MSRISTSELRQEHYSNCRFWHHVSRPARKHQRQKRESYSQWLPTFCAFIRRNGKLPSTVLIVSRLSKLNSCQQRTARIRSPPKLRQEFRNDLAGTILIPVMCAPCRTNLQPLQRLGVSSSAPPNGLKAEGVVRADQISVNLEFHQQ